MKEFNVRVQNAIFEVFSHESWSVTTVQLNSFALMCRRRRSLDFGSVSCIRAPSLWDRCTSTYARAYGGVSVFSRTCMLGAERLHRLVACGDRSCAKRSLVENWTTTNVFMMRSDLIILQGPSVAYRDWSNQLRCLQSLHTIHKN